jgi:hypothetical protein
MDTQLQKPSRKSSLINLILVFAAFFGILVLVAGLYLDYRKKILSFNTVPQLVENSREINNLSKPAAIRIVDAGIEIAIKESEIVDGVWEIKEGSANYLKTSTRPGGNGNIILLKKQKRNKLLRYIRKMVIYTSTK